LSTHKHARLLSTTALSIFCSISQLHFNYQNPVLAIRHQMLLTAHSNVFCSSVSQVLSDSASRRHVSGDVSGQTKPTTLATVDKPWQESFKIC